MPDSFDAQQLEQRRTQVVIALTACGVVCGVWVLIPHPAVSVLALLPVIILMGLQAPFLLSVAFVAFSFFRLHEVFPQLYSLRIPQLLAVGTLASLIFNLALGRLQGYWTRELSTFLLFFILVTIGVLLATNTAAAMGSWSGTYVKIGIMVVAIAWLSRGEYQFRIIMLVMVICGIAVGAVALFNKANGLELVEGTRVTIGRSIGSMLGDPNDLSLVLLFPASFAIGMILTEGMGKSYRLLGVIGLVVVICAIIATQSRGGLLGICAVCGVYAWRRVENKALLIMAGGSALMILFVLAGVSDRASGGSHEEGIDESAMGRIYAWQAAFGMALHHPLTGVGLNNFLSNYFSYSPHWDGQNHAVHSTWFGVMAETGILGLIVFIAMIIQIARITFKAVARYAPQRCKNAEYSPFIYAMAQSVQAGLAGFCVSGTFLTMGFTWPIYILLSLAVALSQIPKTHSQSVSHIEKAPSA